MCFWLAGTSLLPDFFLDTAPADIKKQMEEKETAPKTETTDSSAVDKTFDTIGNILNEDMVKSVKGIFQFNITGKT